MFSPALLVFNSENADSVAQRKPGISALPRKPFFDISVNSKTPDPNKLLKQKQPLKQVEAKPARKPKSPLESDLNAEDFTFSYKEPKDCYDDIWGKPPSFGTAGIIEMLRKYSNMSGDTPPPSPVKESIYFDQVFFDVPVFNPLEQEEQMGELSLDDIEVPSVDFDVFDVSY